MDFLIKAERYSEDRGDEIWFNHFYSKYREYNNVEDSVWKTLSYLYSDSVADLLLYQ